VAEGRSAGEVVEALSRAFDVELSVETVTLVNSEAERLPSGGGGVDGVLMVCAGAVDLGAGGVEGFGVAAALPGAGSVGFAFQVSELGGGGGESVPGVTDR
jgi:hypothetical protein